MTCLWSVCADSSLQYNEITMDNVHINDASGKWYINYIEKECFLMNCRHRLRLQHAHCAILLSEDGIYIWVSQICFSKTIHCYWLKWKGSYISIIKHHGCQHLQRWWVKTMMVALLVLLSSRINRDMLEWIYQECISGWYTNVKTWTIKQRKRNVRHYWYTSA